MGWFKLRYDLSISDVYVSGKEPRWPAVISAEGVYSRRGHLPAPEKHRVWCPTSCLCALLGNWCCKYKSTRQKIRSEILVGRSYAIDSLGGGIRDAQSQGRSVRTTAQAIGVSFPSESDWAVRLPSQGGGGSAVQCAVLHYIHW
jgi:hypothetical protein